MAYYDKENYFTFVHKVGEDSYEVFYPKTVAQQVIIDKFNTMADHVKADTHLNTEQRNLIRRVNQANGIVKLDGRGYVPLEMFDTSIVLIKIQHDTIADMLADSSTLSGSMAFVLDASADPTVHHSWAVYRRTDSANYNILGDGWVKVFENESIDVDVTWEVLQDTLGIQSSAQEVDQMVADDHTHHNKTLLDQVGEDIYGHPTYNGKSIAFDSEVSRYFWEDYINKSDMRIGDIWFQGSICQSWWSDETVEYAGTSCYERYMDQGTITSIPRLRTNNVTTARRMCYRCYNLTDVPQYDWGKLTDGLSMYEEASSIETLPYMNTYRLQNAERMFYGMTSLKYSPEMSLRSATTMKEIFMGDINLLEVFPFGSTANVSIMTGAFRGCDSLEKIDSAIDFSSVESSVYLNNMFKDCIELRDLSFVENTLSVSLSLEDTNLSTESLTSVFNGLVEFSGQGTAPTLNIKGIEAVADLTPAQKAIAYNKGWTIVEDTTHIETTTNAQLISAIANASGDDVIFVNTALNTVGEAIELNTADEVSVVLNEDMTTDGSKTSGIRVHNGTLNLAGSGVLVNNTPYGSGNGNGVISVDNGGELVFNGSGVNAVISDDPVNKGQFGVTVFGDGKVTVNDGDFVAGWYCISGNGAGTSEDSVTEINGGTFKSIADYALYHPHPGSLIINGGDISGAAGALAANNGYIEINGGTLTVLGGGDTGTAGDGTSGLGNATINLNARYGDITCRITGGTFIANGNNVMIQAGTAHNVTIEISGGRFTSKPDAAWIRAGYACSATPDKDGFYVVSKA